MDNFKQKQYEEWLKQTEKIKKGLLSRKNLLRQYSTWMKTSEEVTVYSGKDVFDMIIGSCLYLSDSSFIPGTGNMNLVYVLAEVQKESGIDLGVCKFLDDKILRFMEEFYCDKHSEGLTPQCKENQHAYIGDLSFCIPPNRLKCVDRVYAIRENLQVPGENMNEDKELEED